MYVRTERDGIGLIIKKYEDDYLVEIHDKSPYLFQKKELSEPSDTIIKLIEEGDYVNGKVVRKKAVDYYNLPYIWIGDTEEIFYDNEIKTVVTKEQFEFMQYEVH